MRGVPDAEFDRVMEFYPEGKLRFHYISLSVEVITFFRSNARLSI